MMIFSRHVTALLIKFVMIAIISIVLLPLFSQITAIQAFVIALVLTIVAYLAGDLWILHRYGNVYTTIADVVMAALVIGIADQILHYTMTITAAGWIITLALIAFGEWYFHKYLVIPMNTVGNEPPV
ncbi:DUF2512 family protein [Pelotomaculum sp. FP]|uniref:DUF2512 family protein n=1 Tax=Pelotomaculum sp. FP TaxID=261474 RepID=UPI001065EC2D|nr:DUF2512 family protein [Pelotomaculum sp. FP]